VQLATDHSFPAIVSVTGTKYLDKYVITSHRGQGIEKNPSTNHEKMTVEMIRKWIILLSEPFIRFVTMTISNGLVL
jgi:hypothetical protein